MQNVDINSLVQTYLPKTKKKKQNQKSNFLSLFHKQKNQWDNHKTEVPEKTETPETNRPLEKEVLCGICIGDMVGARYEGAEAPDGDWYQTQRLIGIFNYFTDDSLMSLAVFEATSICRQNGLKGDAAIQEYIKSMRKYAKRYPDVGFGTHFKDWAVYDIEDENYQSLSDGSAMRSGIIGAMFEKVEDVIYYAICSALPTHSHPEGIKGAVVTAVLVWMGTHRFSKEDMKQYIVAHYPPVPKSGKYFNQVHPSLTTQKLLDNYAYETMDVACRTAVPLAFINFYETDSFENCLRNCLRYTCDADTVMAISGGIAVAYYGETTIEGHSYEEIIRGKFPDDLLQIFPL